ncbi:ribonuclease [Bacillus aerolatus]|uniref:Ribonuclease n=1 Tax=Bacillus aerolatus TaxID=2653354 RepID=A0A6I1FNT2_9BACI|nr:YlzJ-like family protein [Bacillus aerolatus]KAB7708104.1 ribonuclease [Bacillus aerolatus]
MILYTVMPQEYIFPQSEQANNLELVTWNGIPLFAEREEHQYKVIRVISTNPAHYLNQQVAPGQFISL